MRMLDIAAHEALGHGIRHDGAQRSCARELHGQRLLVLEVRREEQRPRHRAAESRRRDGQAVVAAHGFADEMRRPGRIDAEVARHRLDQSIFHRENSSFFKQGG